MTLAHRGHSTTIPEQTMAAFEAAVAAGADAIEADVHLTRDGHLVMLHDDLVDRTTDGHGLVRDMTLAEVARLDAGSWFGPQFRGARVPTLEQLLDLARGSRHHPGAWRPRVTTTRRPGTSRWPSATRWLAAQEIDRHVLSSFDYEALAEAGARHAGLTLAPDRLPERGFVPDADVIDQARRSGRPSSRCITRS